MRTLGGVENGSGIDEGRQVLTPLEELISKGCRRGVGLLLCTQGVGGSNPPVSTTRSRAEQAFPALPSPSR